MDMTVNASALLGQARDSYAAAAQKRAASGVQGSVQGGAQGGAPGGINVPGSDANLKAAKTTADDFESFFIGQMLEQMWAGVEVDPEFGGGHAEEMWRSMLNQEYGKHIVKSGGLGISNQVMTAMLKAQEEQATSKQKLAAAGVVDAPADGMTTPAAAAGTLRREV